MNGQDEYVLTDTIEYPNARVRVFRPILTEEERERRYEAVKKAAAALVLDAYEKGIFKD